MNKLIAIVGMCGSGKSIASDFFENKDYKKIYFGGVTMDKLKESGLEVTPDNEKMMRENLRKQYGMAAYAIILKDRIKEQLDKSNVVIDGLYSWDELMYLKQEFENIKVLSIIVNKDIRYERLSKRTIRPFNNQEAINRDISEIENLKKGGPIAYADYYILNNSDLDNFIKQLEEVK